ncbi:adenylate kinase [Demequina activiva]|uniref:Adenylate kinase n=1 Tax=Demequina activiva TaxID=1582364 RepID=A0A919UK06_9MICO|nr:adenylate kinase [Demequina activiva]
MSQIAQAVRASAPRLPRTRVVLVDGPAGSGKTTVANHLAVELGGAPSAGAGTFDPATDRADDAAVQILHADDMYEGWGGLDALDEVLLDQILEPLAAGRDAGFHMWDWHRSERTHRIPVPPRAVLIVEGVGVASPRARAHAVLTVWVEAPADVRLRRGIERDGEAMREEWERWQSVEARVLDAHDTRSAADVVVDGTGVLPDASGAL